MDDEHGWNQPEDNPPVRGSGTLLSGWLYGTTYGDNDSNGDNSSGDDETLGDPEYTENRPEPGGTSMDDMPDLEGELVVYSGRSQPRVGELIEYLEDRYEDFTLDIRYDDTDDLINAITVEAETPADVSTGATPSR